MTTFQAVILGLVQGLTEFLPVSSSGHLVMIEQWFNLSEEMFLTIALHAGTLFAVLYLYRKQVGFMLTHPFSPLSKNIMFASVPTVIIVLALKGVVPSIFSSCFYIVGFAITAVVLIVTECLARTKKCGQVGYKSSIIIGIAQGLACLPGISRSGSTICAGILCGEDKKSVADFSFLLSIPIIFASILYELIFNFNATSIPVLPLLIGMLTSFISGLFAIKLMLKLVKKSKLYYFSIYLFILSFLLVIFNC